MRTLVLAFFLLVLSTSFVQAGSLKDFPMQLGNCTVGYTDSSAPVTVGYINMATFGQSYVRALSNGKYQVMWSVKKGDKFVDKKKNFTKLKPALQFVKSNFCR